MRTSRQTTIGELRPGEFFCMGGSRGMCQYSGNLWYTDEYGQKLRFSDFQRDKIVFLY